MKKKIFKTEKDEYFFDCDVAQATEIKGSISGCFE
jgi:hypothetical protein